MTKNTKYRDVLKILLSVPESLWRFDPCVAEELSFPQCQAATCITNGLLLGFSKKEGSFLEPPSFDFRMQMSEKQDSWFSLKVVIPFFPFGARYELYARMSKIMEALLQKEKLEEEKRENKTLAAAMEIVENDLECDCDDW